MAFFSEFCTVSYLKLVKCGIKIRSVRSKVIFVYISGCSNGWRKYSCNNSSHNLSWYVDFDLLALMVFFGIHHAKIWHRDHKIWFISCVYCLWCWCHYSYGRKPKAVSNLNFLLSCFSWWSSPGRLYEKTTLGMFQWASVIWGGEIIITITSSIIITSIPSIFMSLRSPEWPLTLKMELTKSEAQLWRNKKMEVTKSEVQLWRNEQTISLKHLMCVK